MFFDPEGPLLVLPSRKLMTNVLVIYLPPSHVFIRALATLSLGKVRPQSLIEEKPMTKTSRGISGIEAGPYPSLVPQWWYDISVVSVVCDEFVPWFD